MALEEEIDNGDTDNADHVRGKAWSIVVEILACVVVLEQRQSPHFGIPVQDKEWQHEVIPEPKGIDDHGCRMHGFHHWEDDAEIGCKLISPIDLCCFIQTFWNRDFDIPYIEKEGLWNRIGQVEQDQTKGVSQTEFTHHNRNRNHDDLERYENPKDQEGVHDGKGFSLTHITSDGVGCHRDKDHYCK